MPDKLRSIFLLILLVGTAACGSDQAGPPIDGSPLMTEMEVLGILYVDLMGKARASDPLTETPREFFMLSLLFSNASFAALKAAVNEWGEILEQIIAGTPMPMPTPPNVSDTQLLMYEGFETKIRIDASRRLATYSGEGWWTVRVIGEWLVNERTREVRANDQTALLKSQELEGASILRLRELARQHDVTSREVREQVRQLRIHRGWDTRWTERKEPSISSLGVFMAGKSSTFEKMTELWEEAELYPEVLVELQVERDILSGHLTTVEADRNLLRALTTPKPSLASFYDAADRAMRIEADVLSGLLTYYRDEEFIRKGRVVVNDTVLMLAEDLIADLLDAPDQLNEALIVWESAKLRLEQIEVPVPRP